MRQTEIENTGSRTALIESEIRKGKSALGIWAAAALAAAIFLPASAQASALATVDLASSTAWTCKGETEGGWSVIAMPGQKRAGTQKWVDFRRTFVIPNVSPTQSTWLRFLSINEAGIVSIDGTPVDTVYYSIFPAEVDITPFVKPGGTHTLTVRCFNRSTYHGGIAYIANGYTYSNLGMPRGVFLEVGPQVRIADAYLRTSVSEDAVRRDLWISNQSDRARNITIKAGFTPWNPGATWTYPAIPDQAITIPAKSTIKVSQDPVHWGLGTKSYWWPNIPFEENYTAQLHYLHVSVYEGGQMLDTLTQRFGFAEYTEGPYYYKINGVHVFQSGDDTQESHYPGGTQLGFMNTEGWGPGPNGARESWKRYLRLGMTSYRLHISAATDIMCDAADEVGFMLVPATAILGESRLQESWHAVFKPEAVKGMVRFYRKHPSTARYSLTNEWHDATNNKTIYQGLIDAAMAEDAQRPISFSQDNGPFDVMLPGTGGNGHAWVMSHYREPADDTVRIKGVEEMFWPNKSHDAGFERLDCARAAILYRLRHYAVFHPWCWKNYWGNFIAGGTGANSRADFQDGWGSNVVNFVRNCYHPYASADVDIITNKISNNESDIFPAASAYAFENLQVTSRKMVMFNNGMAPHSMRILWELHMDSANGLRTAIGGTDPVVLQPGDFAQPTITLPLTGTQAAARSVFFVVKTEVDGAVKFTENRYFFRVKNPGQTQVGIMPVTTGRHGTVSAKAYTVSGRLINAPATLLPQGKAVLRGSGKGISIAAP